MQRIAFYIGIFMFAFVGQAQATGFTAVVSDSSPYQGDTLLVSFKGSAIPKSGTFLDKPLTFFSYRDSKTVVIPIPALQKAGSYTLSVLFDTKEAFSRKIVIRARKFDKVVLGIPEDLGLTTGGLLTKLGEQKVSIDSVVKNETPKVYFDRAFGLPLYDNSKITSTFGEIRQTGSSVLHHWGIDLKGREGASVGVMSGGVVVSTYFDTVYGNTIIVDHGEGIYSLYMHLKKINVKSNDIVERGDVIGLLGHTGYATGPHLHLSVKVNSVPVDPIRLVQAFKKKV
ncbi:MAG: M23 family metallopeptidase [bacterium]|nr:M23 family metallopeptidase [Candidatus Jorgensenbacteria bacterium]